MAKHQQVSNNKVEKIQPLTTNTCTASVVDVACVTVLLANVNVSRLSLAKAVAARHAPMTAVDTASAAPMPTRSILLGKLPRYHSVTKFLLTPRLTARQPGVFTGLGSNTSSATAMLVTKATIAPFAAAPKVMTPKLSV